MNYLQYLMEEIHTVVAATANPFARTMLSFGEDKL